MATWKGIPVRVLITGGAGFIGSNLADRCLARGDRVTILDNFSRPGSEANLEWLIARHGEGAFRLVRASVLDRQALRGAVEGSELVVHLAAQVAVTSSLVDPLHDFRTNAMGTLCLLEAARRWGKDPILLYASTNKVYGSLAHLRLLEGPTRYTAPERPSGIAEDQPLDLATPYACSKGCGDQYTREWARAYGLRTVVLRQSCVYGPRQFGAEDQGWVAWFMIATLAGRRITIYGDGRQVRDLLFVEDLLDAYDAAVQHIDAAAGGVFNIGGGLANTVSVWAEFSPRLAALLGRQPEATFAPARSGDQRWYVSDIRHAGAVLGWQPRTPLESGLERLQAWIVDHRSVFA